VILKATKVDGVYTADPKRDPSATKFERLGYLEVLNRGIEVMDNTALTLCMDNDVPIVVFNLLTPGNIERVVMGEEIGTLVGASARSIRFFASRSRRWRSRLSILRTSSPRSAPVAPTRR